MEDDRLLTRAHRPESGELTFARTVVLDDGTYREVHLTKHAAAGLKETTGGVEGTGITTEEALARMELAHRLFGGRSLWATKVYDIPDADAIKGDVRGI